MLWAIFSSSQMRRLCKNQSVFMLQNVELLEWREATSWTEISGMIDDCRGRADCYVVVTNCMSYEVALMRYCAMENGWRFSSYPRDLQVSFGAGYDDRSVVESLACGMGVCIFIWLPGEETSICFLSRRLIRYTKK